MLRLFYATKPKIGNVMKKLVMTMIAVSLILPLAGCLNCDKGCCKKKKPAAVKTEQTTPATEKKAPCTHKGCSGCGHSHDADSNIKKAA